MSKSVLPALLTASLLAGFSMSVPAAEPAPSLDPLLGKWSVAKSNPEGQRYSQVIEIKKDQFVFRLLGEDNQLRLFAKGKVKTDRGGPLTMLMITDIEAGRSADDLQPVDDPRTVVYVLRGDKLYVATDFDKERENEKPSVDVYLRVEAPKDAAALPMDESKLLGTWKVEVTAGDATRDYELRIEKTDGKLEATLVSPRSGDHKFKSVVCQGNDLIMELDREMNGQDVTLVYKAKRTADGLSGTLAAKGGDDQYNARWKATK